MSSAAGTLVGLKLRLLGNAFRRSTWQTVGFVLGAIYAVGMVALAVGGAVVGGWLDPGLTGDVLVLAGAGLVLGWLLVPLFIFGVDATLDVQRFATFGIPLRELLTGLAASAVISVPGAATVLAVLGAAFAWLRDPIALLFALVGAVGAVGLCVLGSRALTTWLAPLLEGRKARELLTVLALVALMLVGPLISWVSQRVEAAQAGGAAPSGYQMRDFVAELAAIVGWTPFGAPWGVARAAHGRNWLAVLAQLVILAAALGGAWVWWRHGLVRELENPHRVVSKERAKGLGFFAQLPDNPTGAVAARTLTYWLRDPRYAASLVVVPLMPLALIVSARAGGGEAAAIALGIAPLVAWVLSFSISNDIGYDYSAFALHVSSGVSGRADRWGRALPVLAFGAPLALVFSIISVAVAGRWDALAPILGLSLGLLLSGLGISSAASARWVYPVPKPGESPLKTPQGSTGATMVAQGANLGLIALVMLPTMALTLIAIIARIPWLGWIAFVVGIGLGVLTLILGVRWGAAQVERHAPELLQKVLAWT